VDRLTEVVEFIRDRKVTSKVVKDLLERGWIASAEPYRKGQKDLAASVTFTQVVADEGLGQTSDPTIVEKFVDDVIAANEKVVADYKSGKTNVAGFLVGQVMKASRGKADPALVNELLQKKLDA